MNKSYVIGYSEIPSNHVLKYFFMRDEYGRLFIDTKANIVMYLNLINRKDGFRADFTTNSDIECGSLSKFIMNKVRQLSIFGLKHSITYSYWDIIYMHDRFCIMPIANCELSDYFQYYNHYNRPIIELKINDTSTLSDRVYYSNYGMDLKFYDFIYNQDLEDAKEYIRRRNAMICYGYGHETIFVHSRQPVMVSFDKNAPLIYMNISCRIHGKSDYKKDAPKIDVKPIVDKEIIEKANRRYDIDYCLEQAHKKRILAVSEYFNKDEYDKISFPKNIK